MTEEQRIKDEQWMQQALKEARLAYDEEEIPIGAVVVLRDRIIARGHNQTERLNDSTAHAEMIALTSAFNYLSSKYLPEATIYISVEPCLMCAGALYWSKIGRVVYGADDDKNGYRRGLPAGTAFAGDDDGMSGPRKGMPAGRPAEASNWPFHPKTELTGGILKEECARLMTDFFRQRR